MINNVDEDNPYKDWVNVAHLLDPPFDYINFADTCYLDARTTNCIYLSILNNHLLKAKKKAHGPILTAIKSFNRE
ncbi:hypothetical protein BD770DRAFT_20188 [Pilaira anomala]|nr:hypothetical protein BD770DRAFT_20188 [Pilaira anomala]